MECQSFLELVCSWHSWRGFPRLWGSTTTTLTTSPASSSQVTHFTQVAHFADLAKVRSWLESSHRTVCIWIYHWWPILSGGLGGFLVTFMTTSKDFKGIRAKFLATALGMLPAIPISIYNMMSQKYDIHIHYDRYKARFRSLDPMWTDFAERAEKEEAEQAAREADNLSCVESQTWETGLFACYFLRNRFCGMLTSSIKFN